VIIETKYNPEQEVFVVRQRNSGLIVEKDKIKKIYIEKDILYYNTYFDLQRVPEERVFLTEDHAVFYGETHLPCFRPRVTRKALS